MRWQTLAVSTRVFSAPRARNNQNRAFGVVDGGKLLWIEIEVVHSVIIQPFMRRFRRNELRLIYHILWRLSIYN